MVQIFRESRDREALGSLSLGFREKIFLGGDVNILSSKTNRSTDSWERTGLCVAGGPAG